MKLASKIAFLLSLVSILAATTFAQVTTGTPPFGAFGGGPADTINLGNLNVHLDMPVLHKAGRGVPFNYDVTYDTSLWAPPSVTGSSTWQPISPPNWSFGWFFPVQGAIQEIQTGSSFCGSPYPTGGSVGFGFIYYDPLGTPHPLQGGFTYTWGTCGTNSYYFYGGGPATDGSGYVLSGDSSGNIKVTAKDGNVVYWSNSQNTYVQPVATDDNGNEITVDTSSSVFTDTLGVTALTLGGSGTPSSPKTFTYTAPSGANAVYKIIYTAYTVKTNFGCSGISEYGPTAQNLPSELDLPDGSKYIFTYESTPGYSGDVTTRLASVKLPTGGTIYYIYSGTHDGIECADGSTSGLTRQTPDGTWTYARTINGGAASTTTITDPQNNQTVINFVGIYPTETQVYQGSSSGGTLLKTTLVCYDGSTPSGYPATCNSASITLPITRKTVYTQWPGTNAQQSKTDTYFNSYGLVTENDEYDYGAGSPGSLVRKTLTSYVSLGNGIVDRPAQVSVYDGASNLKAQINYYYDQTGVVSSGITTQHISVSGSRGNPTSVSRWLNTTGTYLTSTNTYFDTGMVNVAKDPKLNPTTYGYSLTYQGAYPTTITNALNQTTTNAYNIYTGQLMSTTDPNNQTTSYTYDSMLRPLSVSYPDGGQTTYSYANPNEGDLSQKITSSMNRTGSLVVDGLGREIQQIVSNGETVPYDQVDTCYDAFGRVGFTSYPYQGTGLSGSPCPSSKAGDSFTYDPLARTTKVTHSDGSYVSISYSGNSTTVTDEQGKARESFTDGLGRLTQVIENPGGLNYSTTYGYDTLDNLTGVTQAGSRQRTFVYDSLSRLTSATNPESGATAYTYDADGNVATKTDARNITTTYSYDALNRLTGKTYSDSTPTATYYYDQSAPWGWNLNNFIGRLTTASTAATGSAYQTATLFNYDPMGRITTREQCQPQGCTADPSLYTVSSYNLIGNRTSLVEGQSSNFFTISYGYNLAGRPASVSSSLVDSQHPATLASGIHYNAAGGVTAAALGNGLTQSAAYNPRVQPCRMNVNSSGILLAGCGDAVPSGNVLDLGFNYGSADNGNITSWTATGWQNFSRGYTYDSLNRLATLSDTVPGAHCPGLSWTYDAWGNRTDQNVTSGTCGTFHQSVDANNRLSGTPYQYDAAGNMTHDASHSYTYDAENRLTQVDGGSTASYLYDAEGRRVVKTTPAGWNDYLYDASGNVVAETYATGWGPGYVYLGSQLVAEYENSTTYFAHTDHLGSTRLLTAVNQSVTSDMDYLPFGEMFSPASGVAVVDPGFENGTSGWVAGFWGCTSTTTTAQAHSGSYSLAQTGSTSGGSYEDIQGLVPGNSYNVSMWVKADSGTTARAALWVHDTNGGNSVWSSLFTPGTSWQQVSVTFTADSTSAIRIHLYYGAGSGTIYYDDVQIQMTSSVGNGGTTHLFTGYERDAESGNDYALARYYGSSMGRFMSPDPLGNYFADGSNPQSWNLYSYVQNNPLSFIDPTGLCGEMYDYSYFNEDTGMWVLAPQYDGARCDFWYLVRYFGVESYFGNGGYYPTGGGGGGGGGGSPSVSGNPPPAQPQPQPQPPQNRLVCAAQTADKHSIAGALGTTNKTGFFANLFNGIAGNSVSGIVMAFNHGNKWNTVGGVADATLGISPAAVSALTAPAATTELNLTGVGEFANFAGDGLGGIFAAGKLIYDAGSFGVAYFSSTCKSGGS